MNRNRIKRFLNRKASHVLPPTYPPIPANMANDCRFVIIHGENIIFVSWSDELYRHNVTFNVASGANSTWSSTNRRLR